ncbi:MAG: hypothetical protein KC496_16465 [Anaerolineae bacterium]|nr:hypothetical protein [Anaerolineae bacterium]
MSNNNNNQLPGSSRLPGSAPSNPFASRTNNNNQSNNSPFGGSSSSSSRFGGSRFSSRFGRSTVNWTVTPLYERAVRFSLEGLGDPFQRLLGMPLNPEMRSIDNVMKALSEDPELAERLSNTLDEIWASYGFVGAAMLFPYDAAVRRAYVEVIQPLPPQPEQADSDDDSDEDESDSNDTPEIQGEKPKVAQLRAIDLGLVLNVLARSRANVLVGNTPLALETGFLQQTFVCDDPRIVDIAEATGCIEDGWG